MISEEVARDVECWAQAHLAFDPHAVVAQGNAYRIHSLYLDTPDLAIYHRAPSHGRRKFRVRRYGSEPAVYLERKTKKQGRVSKRRTFVTDGELARLLEPAADPAWPAYWFQRRLLDRGLQPTCQISYDRTAHVGMNGEGPMRLTLDRNVTCAAAHDWRVGQAQATLQLLRNTVVLELKYRTALPTLFKRLVHDFKLSAAPGSKYRLAVEAWRLHDKVKEAG
jgi:hypothetical protein